MPSANLSLRGRRDISPPFYYDTRLNCVSHLPCGVNTPSLLQSVIPQRGSTLGLRQPGSKPSFRLVILSALQLLLTNSTTSHPLWLLYRPISTARLLAKLSRTGALTSHICETLRFMGAACLDRFKHSTFTHCDTPPQTSRRIR